MTKSCQLSPVLSCDGINEDYGSPILDGDTLEFTCIHLKDPCKKAACECDVELVDQLTRIASSYSPWYSSSEGDFSPEEKCKAKSAAVSYGDGVGSPTKEMECCGEHPRRFPFDNQGDTRGCCGSKTYDKTSLTCCHGTDVMATCTFNVCHPNPCENGGKCIPGSGSSTGNDDSSYTLNPMNLGSQCVCPDGFDGLYCEKV